MPLELLCDKNHLIRGVVTHDDVNAEICGPAPRVAVLGRGGTR